jgi:hypothetical protein
VIVYGCPVRPVVVALGRYMSSREQHLSRWQVMILTLGCQHGLSEKLHLTNELLKVWLSRRVRGNE